MKARFSIAVGIALVLLAISANPASANPLDEFGFGPRGMGMGGANTALADDFSANYYNPAGLASDDKLRIEFGYQFVESLLQLNGENLDVDPSSGLLAGVVIPGEILDRTLAFSIGLFLPDEHISRIRALPQGQPRFVLYDNRPQRLVITTSGALEIIEGLYIGGGLTYVANTVGTLDLTGGVSTTDAQETELLTNVDVALESVRYASAGILYETGPWRFGASFRDEYYADIALKIAVDADILLAGNPIDTGTLDVIATDANLFSPRQVYLGVAHSAPRWSLEFDLGWLQWSRFRAPTARIQIDLDLEALDFDIPGPDDPIEPDFQDVFVPRIGAEGLVFDGQVFDWMVRGGYFFEPSPAPNQPGQTNYVDSDRHGFSLGTTFSFGNFSEVFPQPLLFELAGLFIVLQNRDYEKTDPADPIGDYTANGYIFGLSSTVKFHF